MGTLKLLAAGLMVFGLVSAAGADDKKAAFAKEQLVGQWEVVKSEGQDPPVGTLLDMAKDGKLKITVKQEGETMNMEGTYALAGDKLTVTLKQGDKEIVHTATLIKLTDGEMHADSSQGKKIEFKKKK